MEINIYMMIFKNTMDAVKGQRIFDENSFIYNLMPAPTSITGCCGTSLIFKEDVYNRISSLNIEYKNIYIKKENGFELVA